MEASCKDTAEFLILSVTSPEPKGNKQGKADVNKKGVLYSSYGRGAN